MGCSKFNCWIWLIDWLIVLMECYKRYFHLLLSDWVWYTRHTLAQQSWSFKPTITDTPVGSHGVCAGGIIITWTVKFTLIDVCKRAENTQLIKSIQTLRHHVFIHQEKVKFQNMNWFRFGINWQDEQDNVLLEFVSVCFVFFYNELIATYWKHNNNNSNNILYKLHNIVALYQELLYLCSQHNEQIHIKWPKSNEFTYQYMIAVCYRHTHIHLSMYSCNLL